MTGCPICHQQAERMTFTGASLGHCNSCFHRWRWDLQVSIDYDNQAMAPDYTEERAHDQIAFWDDGTANRIFELGCGSGDLARVVRGQSAVSRYEGLEISPQAAQAADKMDRVYTAWNQLPDEAAYDLVIASHVLEHLPSVDGALAQLIALLAPGGRLFIEVPHRSGHPRLAQDTNPGHLHFFSIQSLAHLLARHGLEITRIADRAFESIRYPDSLRVLAMRPKPDLDKDSLGTLLPENHEPLVVWGAGGIARELVLPFIAPHRIRAFVDKNPKLHGTTLADHPIQPPESLAQMKQVCLLIASIDFEAAIREEIRQHYASNIAHIYTIADLLS